MTKSLTEQPYINDFSDLRNAESNALLELCRRLENQNFCLIKKVKKLQERLADADKALKAMDEKYGEHYTIADGTKMGNSPAWKYMLKWGVK